MAQSVVVSGRSDGTVGAEVMGLQGGHVIEKEKAAAVESSVSPLVFNCTLLCDI